MFSTSSNAGCVNYSICRRRASFELIYASESGLPGTCEVKTSGRLANFSSDFTFSSQKSICFHCDLERPNVNSYLCT